MKAKIINSKLKIKKQKSKKELENEIKIKNAEIYLLQDIVEEQKEFEKMYMEEISRLVKMENMLTLIIQSLRLYSEEN